MDRLGYRVLGLGRGHAVRRMAADDNRSARDERGLMRHMPASFWPRLRATLPWIVFGFALVLATEPAWGGSLCGASIQPWTTCWRPAAWHGDMLSASGSHLTKWLDPGPLSGLAIS